MSGDESMTLETGVTACMDELNEHGMCAGDALSSQGQDHLVGRVSSCHARVFAVTHACCSHAGSACPSASPCATFSGLVHYTRCAQPISTGAVRIAHPYTRDVSRALHSRTSPASHSCPLRRSARVTFSCGLFAICLPRAHRLVSPLAQSRLVDLVDPCIAQAFAWTSRVVSVMVALSLGLLSWCGPVVLATVFIRDVGMRCKRIYLTFGLILVLLLSVSVKLKAYEEDGGYKKCEREVKKWLLSSTNSEVKDDNHALRDLLFFLHVPRTGGRTYFHCFLKKLYPKSQECPRSYDKLRIDPRKPNCRLLSTHDDYSMMSKLPKEKTSVVTILRNPVDRVFSTYEFSVEVAARFLVHPNLTSVARMDKRIRRKKSGVGTLDIWPWKYLVPWMREDLFARRDRRKLRGETPLVTNNSYDMVDMVMPLHKYIKDPIARDIVHNGATFQITGLTNNSYFPEARKVRHCVLKYPNLGKYVLEVAKGRLDKMLYIGLTENHKESASMFANIVGTQVISQHSISSSSKEVEADSDSEHNSLLSDTESDSNDQGNSTNQTLKNVSSTSDDELSHENLTIGKLMDAYEPCIANLRNSHAERRVASFNRISPANFTKESRSKVPDALIHEIELLNSLDVELYSYAQHIFEKQRAHIQSMASAERLDGTLSTGTYPSLYSSPAWKVPILSITGLLLLINPHSQHSEDTITELRKLSCSADLENPSCSLQDEK
ncbi:tyrosylprotein sulfotransferase [Striga asiatica]|uniref:Tyrosylprotein sulfotransferase n=1 Tax=Striga asiatica TaxID=4170 RepID=A0A5A7PKY0_STRAF|nr:tyrosylprotein sulfotransferase [Striga asiatica]